MAELVPAITPIGDQIKPTALHLCIEEDVDRRNKPDPDKTQTASIYRWIEASVARMERSEIREQPASLNVGPGFRFAASGLQLQFSRRPQEDESRPVDRSRIDRNVIERA